MKVLSRALLALYVVLLVRLLLFKLSFGLWPVLPHDRSLNLIPFEGLTRGDLQEPVFNGVVFVPLGVFLSVAFERFGVRSKLVVILVVSSTVEIAQYVLAIGVTDVTDVIVNTFGGFLGLLLYEVASRHFESRNLRRVVTVAGFVMLLLVVLFLGWLLSRGVRYQ